MCGSLRREKQGSPEQSFTPGAKVPLNDKQGNSFEAFWNGHARSETLDTQFISKGWKTGYLDVDEYTEGHKGKRKVYAVPSGKRMKVIFRDIPNRGKIFNIVTRASRGRELEIHPRFPVCE